jgi:bacillopeptidase F (M6 metalloprotease family)
VPTEILTHHRNGQFRTIKGDNPFSTPEMANTLCVTLPYKYNGNVKITNDSFLVFSTDNDDSEIGMFYQNTCTYKKIVSNKCLNFNQSYPISGMVRTDNEGDVEVIFVDGYNSDKIINLSKIAYTFTTKDDVCQTKEFTKELDCEAIKLIPSIKIPTRKNN